MYCLRSRRAATRVMKQNVKAAENLDGQTLSKESKRIVMLNLAVKWVLGGGEIRAL